MHASLLFLATLTATRYRHTASRALLAVALAATGPTARSHAQPAAAEPTPAAAEPAADLSNPNRWNETAYGISLLPPDGWIPVPAPQDNTDFAWHAGDSRRISFKIAYTQVPVRLEQASVQSLVQMGFALDGPRLRRGAEERTIGNRPGSVMLFDVDPPDGGEPWFYAYAVIMLEPYAVAVVTVRSDDEHADAALADFEAVLASLHVPLASELEPLRRAQVEQGQAWLDALEPGTLAAAIPAEQWYRLVFDGQDIGHRRVIRVSDPETLRREERLRERGFSPPGTAVVIHDQRQRGPLLLDREAHVYADAFGDVEIWEIRQTLRPAAADAPTTGLPGNTSDDQDVTWVETGARGPRSRPGTTPYSVVEVVQETPPAHTTVAGVKAQESFLGSAGRAAVRDNDGNVGAHLDGRTESRRWQTPTTGYLGQIEAMGLPACMPTTPGTAFAFYAWDPAHGTFGLRTVRVTADQHPDAAPGGYVVHERGNPSSAETRHRFTADGALIASVIPGGLTVVPATREQMAELLKPSKASSDTSP